jgi:ankyrin repeat protein
MEVDWKSEELRDASGRGDEAAVKAELMREGVEVDGRGWNGRSALHWAAEYGQVKVAEILVSSGADVNLKDK